MGAIEGEQQRTLPGQRTGAWQNPVEGDAELVLAVLGARAQLGTDVPALGAEIGPVRRIAVLAVIGPTHAGLARLAVVQTKQIGMQRDRPAAVGAQRGLEVTQQRDDGFIGHPGELLGLGIEALAQPLRGGHLADPERGRTILPEITAT